MGTHWLMVTVVLTFPLLCFTVAEKYYICCLDSVLIETDTKIYGN